MSVKVTIPCTQCGSLDHRGAVVETAGHVVWVCSSCVQPELDKAAAREGLRKLRAGDKLDSGELADWTVGLLD